MIGVFQTKNLISTYKTNYPEYFVVKDTSDLFLRGIVVTTVCVLEGDALFDFNTLQNYLKERKSSAMETKPTTDQLPVKGSSNKRLMKEYQQLVADKTIPFKFELVEDNLYQWKIIIPRSSFEDEKNSLVVDMDKYKVDHIEMEIRFDTKYPFLPPFLRVVRPRFQPQTSHITSGGSICVDILVQGIWKPTCSIESLILQIKLLILEGDGRLDGVNLNKPYTISDAEDSFVRVAKSHGWM
jgi:ubiquitin-protein ligase